MAVRSVAQPVQAKITLLVCLFLAACAAPDRSGTDSTAQVSQLLEPVAFTDLQGWTHDNPHAALTAFQRSCTRMERQPKDKAFGPSGLGARYGDWARPCHLAAHIDPSNLHDARGFFEDQFVPYRLHTPGGQGLFTGYYEIELPASRTKGKGYTTPIYGYPEDMLTVDLGAFAPEWQGKTITGQRAGTKLIPYPDRNTIERETLEHAPILAWAYDPVDMFFLQIQGSGVLRYPDGTTERIGFAGKNGRPYRSVGKVMIERGLMAREDMTAPALQHWLKTHPRQAKTLMQENPSYVFFRLRQGDGPVGSQGVELVAERALAVDTAYVPLGAPVWIDTTTPETPNYKAKSLQQLMIAQDTGSAIKGPGRGDIFWGYGLRAEEMAGHQKSQGSMTLLLPKPLAARLQERQ